MKNDEPTVIIEFHLRQKSLGAWLVALDEEDPEEKWVGFNVAEEIDCDADGEYIELRVPESLAIKNGWA